MFNSSNGTTDALASNYFTDAYYLGMQKGDVVIMQGCTGSTVNLVIGVLGAVTTAGAAIASTGSPRSADLQPDRPGVAVPRDFLL